MRFSKILIHWYLQNRRSLPWRKTKNPYHIWLSEIILQQTRVDQGMSYYIKFIERFPTVFDLAGSSESEVLKLWQGLGYYSRARNLHYSAKYIVNDCEGIFPGNYKELIKLKGVGDYTASAIASICYNEPSAAVDGNVYRVLARYFGIHTPINSTGGIKEFKLLAQELINVEDPGTYNQAIMEFGARMCKPQNPDCHSCFLNESCVSVQKKWVDILPVKQNKIKVKKRFFNYLVILTKDNNTVLNKRTKKDIWQHLYEFPLIESLNEIEEEELLHHQYFDELNLNQAQIQLFNKQAYVHKLTHQHLYTRFWIVKTTDKIDHKIPWSTLQKYPVPTLIDKFILAFNNN